LAFIPKRGLGLVVAAAGLALPQPAAAVCSITTADRDANGTPDVRLLGDGGRQDASIELNSDGSFFVGIDCNRNGILTDLVDKTLTGPGPVETFFVELAGNDRLEVLQTGDLTGQARNFVIAAGTGASSYEYRTDGHGILGNSRIGIEVVGSGRGETLTLNLAGSTIASSSVVVRAELAAQADFLNVTGPAQVTNSELDVSVDLGTGGNDVVLNDGGAVVTGSDVVWDLQGGEDQVNADLVDATFAGRYEGGSRFTVDAALGVGLDRFSGFVETSAFGVDTGGGSSSRVQIRVASGSGEDELSVQTTGLGNTTVNGLVEVSLDSGAQRDRVLMDWSGLAGSGTLRLRGAGGDAADTVLASVVTSGSSQPDVDVMVSGNAELDFTFEGDTVYAAVVDPGGNASFGPGNAVLLSGGIDGDDFCGFFGSGPHAALGCEAGS
jgi:hypothetical protein